MVNNREEDHGLGADGFSRSAIGVRPSPSVPVWVPSILDGHRLSIPFVPFTPVHWGQAAMDPGVTSVPHPLSEPIPGQRHQAITWDWRGRIRCFGSNL
jgi:hypothetical protein